jgi:hypothetical protein
MKADRRTFLSATLGGCLAALPLAAAPSPALAALYRKLDEILQQPVLKEQVFTAPVIIESLALLPLDVAYRCGVRSRDGAKAFPSHTAP